VHSALCVYSAQCVHSTLCAGPLCFINGHTFIRTVISALVCILPFFLLASLVKSWHRWEDNIKMDLQEGVFEGMDWIDMAQYRDSWRILVNAAMNLRIPQNLGNFLTRQERSAA
jgi:hypothetical protein